MAKKKSAGRTMTYASKKNSAELVVFLVMIVLLASCCLLPRTTHGWSHHPTPSNARRGGTTKNDLHEQHRQQDAAPPSTVSRREALLHGISIVAIVGSTTVLPFLPTSPAHAASIPSPEELSKLQRGHSRVSYLLRNWNDITSICGSRSMSSTEAKQVIRTEGGGGGSCEKSPLRVQEYMGYKSTEDPLFKADKLMVRAVPLVDPDVADKYFDAVERYREKSDQTAMMAYTSSWGEANPNGGKEVVDDYLERTKEDVVETEKLLRQILGYLELDILPPSK